MRRKDRREEGIRKKRKREEGRKKRGKKGIKEGNNNSCRKQLNRPLARSMHFLIYYP